MVRRRLALWIYLPVALLQDPAAQFHHLAALFIKYVQILNRLIETYDRRAICVHLGMSGQLYWKQGVGHSPSVSAGPRPDHVHLQWRIEPDENTARDAVNGEGDSGTGLLIFRDPRRFGEVATYRDARVLLEQRWNELGPDALTIEPSQLSPILRGTRRAIKAVLLDQRALAGVGNIYADESLFVAGIKPTRVARTLKAACMP